MGKISEDFLERNFSEKDFYFNLYHISKFITNPSFFTFALQKVNSINNSRYALDLIIIIGYANYNPTPELWRLYYQH